MTLKRVYLTLDDAPSSHMAKKIDFLTVNNIPALLFCRGEFMPNYLDHVVHAIEKGFIVGNHSYTHPYFSKISEEQALDEILKTEELIDKAYLLANVKRPHKLFRFPYMDSGKGRGEAYYMKLQTMLIEMKFEKACFSGIREDDQLAFSGVDVAWTFDAKEYALFSPEYMKKYHLFTTEDFLSDMEKNDPKKGRGLLLKESSDVVLLHDFETTHHLFEPMVNKLIQMGVQFVLPRFKTSKLTLTQKT